MRRRGRTLRRRYGHTMQRAVVGEYHTRTGKVGAKITRTNVNGNVTYSYTGTWGAGSGHDAAHVRRLIADWRERKRGMREVIRFVEGGTP